MKSVAMRVLASALSAVVAGTAHARTPAEGARAAASSAARQRVTCERLARTTLADARIVSAAPVAAGRFVPPPTPFPPDLARRAATLPAFCRVQAVATPTADSRIAVEIWLPLTGWNGRLLGTGNGGGAGAIPYWMWMIEGLKRGFAVATTDMGTAPDVNAASHPARWADFGFRATHEMTRVAKVAVRAFYGVATFRAYFAGCSTGGQQALSEAQRYPEDYDGILAGAPGHNRTHIASYFLWNYSALNASAASALTPAQWALVTGRVLAACAGKDGGAPGDRFLTDPRRCAFDVETLPKCGPGAAGDTCLTAAQLAALRTLYGGPTNPRTGERIHAGLTPGSEDQPLGPAMQGGPGWPDQQFYPFRWTFGPDFVPASFDFDRDMDRVDARFASLLNANHPDLSAFARRGGKLLLYTGLADPAVPFEEVVTYYERVVVARGDLAATKTFARLFLVPGMGHCSGGPGATEFGQPISPIVPEERAADALMTLVAWAERGEAPDRFYATGAGVGGAPGAPRAPVPERPVCAYPALPEYQGGDPSRRTSFRCVDHARGSARPPAARYLN